jgi:hypothetical protein
MYRLSPPGEGVNIDRIAIAIDDHRTILIGSEYLRAYRAVAVEHLRHGMPEVITPSCADNGDLGADGVQKLPRARGQASVVRHFEDPQPRRRHREGERVLWRFPDVAGEQYRDVAPSQLQHD